MTNTGNKNVNIEIDIEIIKRLKELNIEVYERNSNNKKPSSRVIIRPSINISNNSTNNIKDNDK